MLGHQYLFQTLALQGSPNCLILPLCNDGKAIDVVRWFGILRGSYVVVPLYDDGMVILDDDMVWNTCSSSDSTAQFPDDRQVAGVGCRAATFV